MRKSEKWTQTDMVYLTKGSFWLTTSKIIGAITSILLAYFYANYLTKTDYATYKYIISIAGLLSITTLPGMNTAITRAVALGFEGTVKTARLIKIKWGMSGLFIGLILSIYYYYNGNSLIASGIFIVSIAMPLIQGVLYGPFLEGKKRFKTISQYNSVKNILVAIAVIITMISTKNILFIILALYISNLLFSLLFEKLTIGKNQLNEKTDNETINFGKHISFMNALGIVGNHIDKLILWQLMGPIELAIYSFAILPIEQIRGMLGQFTSLALPKLAAQKNETIKKTLPKKVFKFTIIILVLVLLYILISPYIYNLLFKEYTDSIYFSQIFSLSLLFFPFTLFASTLVAKSKKKELYIVNLTIPVIKIFLLFIFIPTYGIIGALTAIIISKFINIIMLSFLFKNMKYKS